MIIQSKKVWIADQFISAAVELEQGKITGIFPYGEKQADVDYGSKRIVPGFMDIHCHGAYEFDTTTQSRRACATGQSISSLRV